MKRTGFKQKESYKGLKRTPLGKGENYQGLKRTGFKKKEVEGFQVSTIKTKSSKVSARSKACDITARVKKDVWERDGGRCIICGECHAMPNAHYISRADGGLGINENVVTLCQHCHDRLDNSCERETLLVLVKAYLDSFYPKFNDEMRHYRKYNLGA